jgi:hypothetical protein
MKEMHELKLNHARKKSNLDKNFLKSDSSPIAKKVIIESENKALGNIRQVSNPGLIKISKTEEEDYEDEITRKKTTANDINEIVNRYEEPNMIYKASMDLSRKPLGFEREKVKEENLEMHGETINSKNKCRVPVLNLKNLSSERINQDNLFDPVTERECSFINNISINNSNFIYDGDNKDNDVVLCISNLDIDVHRRNNDDGGLNVLQSEEKFITTAKSKFETQNSLNDSTLTDSHNNDRQKLIAHTKKKRHSKYVIFLLIIVILAAVSFLAMFVIESLIKP